MKMNEPLTHIFTLSYHAEQKKSEQKDTDSMLILHEVQIQEKWLR